MGRAVAIGATGFTLTTIAAYSVWAFGGRTLYRSIGELGLYAVCAVVFILLGSFLLRPLTRFSLGKFAAIFTTSFVAYAVAWCASYFVVRGRPGEWAASLGGKCRVLLRPRGMVAGLASFAGLGCSIVHCPLSRILHGLMEPLLAPKRTGRSRPTCLGIFPWSRHGRWIGICVLSNAKASNSGKRTGQHSDADIACATLVTHRRVS